MAEKPRIIGTEMEWPMTVWYDGNDEREQLTTTKSLRFRLPTGLVTVGSGQYMLSNGGRYYYDTGDRVEYATPETTSFDDLVVRELAGEQIVMHSLLDYARENDKIESVVLSKRVSDGFEQGWGYHINLSAKREAIQAINDKTMHLLSLHLATSSPMLGGGAIYHDKDRRLRYSFSQKAISLTGDYINGTTSSKPLINLRDESLMHGMDMRRIHLTSMDPTISPWATKMSVGTVSLVLRAIEQGKGSELALAQRTGNHVLSNLARRIAMDTDMETVIDLADTGSIKAIDVQGKIIDIVKDTEHTEEEAGVLQEWIRAYDTLQTESRRFTFFESDAIAKLALIRAWTTRHNITDFDHDNIVGIDDQLTRLMTYHKKTDASSDVTTASIYARSRAAKLRSTHYAAWMPDDAQVTAAITEPPTTTRAFGRGKAIATGSVVTADWESYRYDKNSEPHRIPDPYNPGNLPTPHAMGLAE